MFSPRAAQPTLMADFVTPLQHFFLTHPHNLLNMSNPGQAFARLAQQLNRARQQAQRSGGGGGGSGGGGPGGLLAGSGLIFVLIGGGLALNASLFNVDGGHRAIKYSRLHGVMGKIYPEGTHIRVSKRKTQWLIPGPPNNPAHAQVPWLETPIIYDVRAKPRNIASLTGTKDLQMVSSAHKLLL